MSISAKRLKEIEAIQDQEIDSAEIPEADESFWQRVELQMPQPKKGIYIRLDRELCRKVPKSKVENHLAPYVPF
ncbi:MAG: hypothetical protein OXC09_00435 [Truepera sp.]|nr:hypothetical protein [Truepera sp.]